MTRRETPIWFREVTVARTESLDKIFANPNG